MDYKKISQDVVDHVGGISNVKGATHCVTRLRLILNDETKYDRKALENIEGVKGVLFNNGQLMIIFGTGTVNNVYDAFIELTGVKEMSQSDAKAEGMSKRENYSRDSKYSLISLFRSFQHSLLQRS